MLTMLVIQAVLLVIGYIIIDVLMDDDDHWME